MLLLSTSAQFLLYFCIFDNLSPLPRRFYNEKEKKIPTNNFIEISNFALQPKLKCAIQLIHAMYRAFHIAATAATAAATLQSKDIQHLNISFEIRL